MAEQTADELKAALRAIIAEVAEVDDVPDEQPLDELGVDSMMAIEIIADVERTYHLSIPEEELHELTSLSRIFERVRDALAA